MTEDFYLRSARHLAAAVFSEKIRPGDKVVDATLGTGQDCVRLAELVGENGKVYGFDVQPEALTQTQRRLKDAGYLDRVELILSGHERMKERVPKGVRLVAFNLGWLPGSGKELTTKAETTLMAVRAALDLLAPRGILVMCIYPGHEEGKREEAEVTAFAKSLSPRHFTVLFQQFINGGPGAPSCLLIEKICDETP